jgi:hypothetical protein
MSNKRGKYILAFKIFQSKFNCGGKLRIQREQRARRMFAPSEL